MRRFLFKAIHSAASMGGFGLASYRMPARRSDLAMVKKIQARRDSLMSPLESVQIINAVRATMKLGGCMAEVGVYAGASARLIRATDVARPLHLFDTFAGLPATVTEDVEFRGRRFEQGEFACSLDSVRSYLSDLPDVTYHVGRFPDTGAALPPLQFSFAHIDVDIYESSRDSAAWFYDRLLPGGILLSHDFATCAGPRRALSEFFSNKPEPLIELAGDQAMIVKL